ncbi:DUF397 domain-containing protein [Streptomyces sp. NBC_00481]|uniref:DUF397 domain-containing protein n=1 Tax=Streptomyces sp. NBC_00481 TaxID=2975755 RepID=UPI002DD81F1A|nr:DUF397 domain-containing protein [Streptomyces sp. NBC_00481]WRY96442.1 DUF397 domain-containing protein [Streptomyces sp. NBC_00481]
MSTKILSWFKSSYSDGEGGECLEAAYTWRKSSHSCGEGGECVQISPCPHTIHIRDSKTPTGPLLTLSPTAWTTFLASGEARNLPA